jgi:hypothetical protein
MPGTMNPDIEIGKNQRFVQRDNQDLMTVYKYSFLKNGRVTLKENSGQDKKMFLQESLIK